MNDLIIYKDELNNDSLKNLIFENGKVNFIVDENYRKLFNDVWKKDIIEIEPEVFLILEDLKGYVNYDYIADINKNKIWKKEKLMRKEVQNKQNIENYLTFFINKETRDLEKMGFLVQDKKTFIEVRFGAYCLDCQFLITN